MSACFFTCTARALLGLLFWCPGTAVQRAPKRRRESDGRGGKEAQKGRKQKGTEGAAEKGRRGAKRRDASKRGQTGTDTSKRKRQTSFKLVIWTLAVCCFQAQTLASCTEHKGGLLANMGETQKQGTWVHLSRHSPPNKGRAERRGSLFDGEQTTEGRTSEGKQKGTAPAVRTAFR